MIGQWSIDAALARGKSQSNWFTMASASQSLTGNRNRLCLVLYPHASNPYRVYPDLKSADYVGGILVTPGDAPLVISCLSYGGLVKEDMLITGTSGDSILFTETLALDEDLQGLLA